MLKRRGARTNPCGTPFLRRRNVLLLPFPVVRVNAIANHLHDHGDHVSVRQQLHQLAGEAVVPYSILGCCEVDQHGSDLLFSRKAVLDVLCQQGGLVHGRPPVCKARLRLWEQWVDDRFDGSSLRPPVVVLALGSQLLVHFSRSLEF